MKRKLGSGIESFEFRIAGSLSLQLIEHLKLFSRLFATSSTSFLFDVHTPFILCTHYVGLLFFAMKYPYRL